MHPIQISVWRKCHQHGIEIRLNSEELTGSFYGRDTDGAKCLCSRSRVRARTAGSDEYTHLGLVMSCRYTLSFVRHESRQPSATAPNYGIKLQVIFSNCNI